MTELRYRDPREAVRDFAEHQVGFTLDEAVRETVLAGTVDLAAAAARCPFGVDVARLVSSVAMGEMDAARAVVLRAHPWPSTLGRWCQQPCRYGPQGAIELNIKALERAAGDLGRGDGPRLDTRPSGRRVAIIGAGSAGLACAHRLRSKGHAVTLFDKLPKPGGMMLVGYPAFRLPLEVVERESAPERWGVATRYGSALDPDAIERITAEHDAVVLAAGKTSEQRLDIGDHGVRGRWGALSFLTEVKLGRVPDVGAHVLICGAGLTAIDAARTCRRLGARVTIVHRRGPDELSIHPPLIQPYLRLLAAEGVEIRARTAPVRVIGRDGRVAAVECEADGTVSDTPCDTFIEAIGETVDRSCVPARVTLTEDGHVEVERSTWRTAREHVYAVGEMAGTRTTMEAFLSGSECADRIDAALRVAG